MPDEVPGLCCSAIAALAFRLLQYAACSPGVSTLKPMLKAATGIHPAYSPDNTAGTEEAGRRLERIDVAAPGPSCWATGIVVEAFPESSWVMAQQRGGTLYCS